MKKNSRVLLAAAVLLCLLSAILAGGVQSDWGGVKISEISLETQAGTLTGYLLKPAGATPETPAPAVVCSHGYLNNREMQDCNWVELARRGYVVIAMNAYGHGDSDVADKAFSGTAEVQSGGMIEFVEYLATLPYVDKTQIGVTGHSMGGGFTNTTMHYYTTLEREALAAGTDPETAHALNKINTGVIVGNYPSTIASEQQGYLCNVAVIEGQYDEFFGSSAIGMLTSDLSKSVVKYHTGTELADGLNQGQFYTNPGNGYSIVMYNPPQFHATNHFSPTVVGYLLDAFQHSMPAPEYLASSNQVWLWKEIWNLVGLAGFFLFIIPFVQLLLDLPCFKELRSSAPALVPSTTPRKRFVVVNVVAGVVITLLTVPFLLVGYVALQNPMWPQDTTGGVGLWCVISGVVTLAAIRIGYGQRLRGHWKELRVQTSWRRLGKTVLLGLLAVAGTYLLVFLADYINQTDFRFWTFDIRVFSFDKIWVAVRYLPFFAVFYIFNSLAAARSSFANWSQGKQIAVTAAFNIIPPVLILLVTYLPTLFLQKTLWVALLSGSSGAIGQLLLSAMALIPILMIPFVPILALAAYIAVRCYRLTDSIWLGATINTLLITMITVANTSFSFAY